MAGGGYRAPLTKVVTSGGTGGAGVVDVPGAGTLASATQAERNNRQINSSSSNEQSL